MVRPRLIRKVSFHPNIIYFKPRGIPINTLNEVQLSHEEIEAYRLRYINNLDQAKASSIMHTSKSTYQRILNLAHKKIADALINGKAIKIIK